MTHTLSAARRAGLTAAAVLGFAALAGCGTTVPLSTQVATYGGSSVNGSGPSGAPQNDGLGDTSDSGSGGQGGGSGSSVIAPPIGSGSSGSGSDGSGSTGAGSTSSGSTGQGNGSSSKSGGHATKTKAGKGATSAPAVHIPTTGPAWDAHNVYIGVMTVNDFSTASAALGAKDSDPGNQEDDAQTMATLLNRQGGLFGRKVVIAYDNVSTASLLVDAQSDAAQACTHFTQDRPVIAVYNDISPLDTPTMRACFQQAKVPLFNGSIQSTSQAALAVNGGYVTSVVSPSYTALAPTFVARLQAERYFTGWNVNSGTSGSSPVKVAIIAENVPTDQQAAELLSGALARDGHPPVAQFNYTVGASGTTSNLSSAVLQFRSRGITHVIGADAGTEAFMEQAQAQHYYPRYGINSIDLPASGLTPDAPRHQLQGALGIGWYPSLDVESAQDPGYLLTVGRNCLTAQQKAQSYSVRFEFAIGTSYCDSFGLMRAAVLAGGGFTGPDVVRGEGIAGPAYIPSGTFRSSLHNGDWAIPGAGRDLGWITKCQCFQYLSSTDYPFGS